MKSLVIGALFAFSAAAGAATLPAAQNNSVQEYTYGTHLDIAKVVSMTSIPDVCEVVPASMTYLDHQGERHTVEYRVMGNGCQNN
ncbi:MULTISPECIES: DUF2790 domain-containing protein [unclassified Pseudomonas]|uniref:DUF2790 domain-containing protein n=1 Tax=unclassified Pseudomonas TaxID=196821 RepID=UPI000307906A|nr:DUF2790 domain-containing protein [Pseudomonas sp. M47T1]